MSKTTVKNQVRVCIFTVTCVDWQGHPFRYGSMARLYSLTYRWEKKDRDSGAFLGTFSDPVPLVPEGDWTDVLKAVKSFVSLQRAVSNRFAKGSLLQPLIGQDWEPLFLTRDGGYASRLVKEINSWLVARSSTCVGV